MEEFGVFLLAVAWGVMCWLGFAFVTVPLTFVAVAAGLLCGATLATMGYLRVYRGAEDTRVLVRPDAAAPRGPRAPYPRWDGGWPGYLSRQVDRDVLAAIAWPGHEANRWLAAGSKQASSNPGLLIGLLPATPGLFAFFVGVMAGVYAWWAVLAAAVEGVAILPRLARLFAIGALRAVDASVRWWRGAALTCPGCRHVAWLPAYPCDDDRCAVVHHDLRPGRLGVLVRRCQCGTPLPTMVLRAARVLRPACPSCGDPLPPRVGVITDVRIALAGGAAVGKTRLLVRAAVEMTGPEWASPWEPADQHTTTWLRGVQATAGEPHPDGPEPLGEHRLLTFRRHTRGESQYFHVADVDGRNFETDSSISELWQIGSTRRHLLVLDATLFPSIRDRLYPSGSTGRGSGMLSNDLWADTRVAKLELPYRLLVTQLNRLGARTRRCSLALVITKADCLTGHDLVPGRDAGVTSAKEIREWLRTTELHVLVEAAEHDFARVRCFLAGEGLADAAAPFEWLLRQYPHGTATA